MLCKLVLRIGELNVSSLVFMSFMIQIIILCSYRLLNASSFIVCLSFSSKPASTGAGWLHRNHKKVSRYHPQFDHKEHQMVLKLIRLFLLCQFYNRLLDIHI